MTITQIAEKYTWGSQGFIKELDTWHGNGFDIMPSEIERICEKSTNEAEFIYIWENEDWWTDANNGVVEE